ncbi:alpha/beta hydrolase-fold protein [Porcipelethomonas sp.]|uniref:alpha/beta hydrolase-fold protein n=1 Tax=Porcipelethomonas sp. TaxID=2981675 RepID=UPI003EFA8964
MRIKTKRIRSIMSAFIAGTVMISAMPSFVQMEASAADNCVIDISTEYQTIKGFGGMNHPEWTGKDLTETQVQTAFGNGENEIGMSVVRIYVNDDPDQWYKAVPTAKAVIEKGGIVFATPWNPPAELCETFTRTYTQWWDGKVVEQPDQKRLRHDKYAEYAQHLNDFVHYMKDNGVDLYAISIQNEPDYGEDWTWMTEDECVDFLENYADKIDCPVMSPESFSYNKSYYNAILNSSKAYANTDIFGTHFYGTSRDNMDFPALENCGKEIFMTEVYTDSNNDADLWPMALDVSENIHNGLVVGNMNAYVWWYIRRSYGPMKEDGKISKRGYCMAQYSKFVRPGDVRIEATEQPADDVYISAYKNDENQVTIVAVNKGSEGYAQNFTVSGQTIGNVDRYRTSATENIAYTSNLETGENNFWAQLPAESVSTFVVTLSEDPDENGFYFHDDFENSDCDWASRGSGKVGLSGRTPYMGTNALLISERTESWNGAEKLLNTSVFKAGESYSFSVDVKFLDGKCTEKMLLTLQYTDSDGHTRYENIDSKTAVRGEYVQLYNRNFIIPAGASDAKLVVETSGQTMNFYIDEAVGTVAGIAVDGPEEISFVPGDINRDGIINIFDLILAKRLVSNGFENNLVSVIADVNQDGTPDTDDIVQIQDFLIKKINNFQDAEISDIVITPEAYMDQVSLKILESEPSDATEEKSDVSYGTYEKVTFYSDVCNRDKSMNVLLPSGYTTDKKYPIMYVLHGYWGDEDALLDAGDVSLRLRQIIGNAIASGEAEEMIVVFPDIYASDTQDKCDGLNDKNNKAYDNFINVLTKEIMPYMEKNYSVKTGRDNTAITGFSMGGRESLYIGFSRPDLFGYVGAMCPAPGLTTDLIAEEDLKFDNTSPYLLMVSAGSNDQVVWSTPSGYHDAMNNNSVTHVWHYVTDGDHGGYTIRPHIYNFVRAVFKAS